MRFEDAKRLLGQRVAVNANGGELVVGKLVGIIDEPSILIDAETDDCVTHKVTLVMGAVDGWVVEGTPPRLGGEEVSG